MRPRFTPNPDRDLVQSLEIVLQTAMASVRQLGSAVSRVQTVCAGRARAQFMPASTAAKTTFIFRGVSNANAT
jgi:hypothetical protein